MRSIKRLIASITLVTLIFSAAVPVLAQVGQPQPNEPRGNSTEQQSQELANRLSKRKGEFKKLLSVAEKTRLGARCKNSQGNLRSVEGRIKGIETSRTKVYGNIITRLSELATKLEAKNVDTTQFKEQLVALQSKINEFNINLENYKQAVTDLGAMDCQKDPDAFKASLEEARSLRQKLRTSGQDIRTYIKDVIKPTLTSIRTELNKTDDTNQEEAN